MRHSFPILCISTGILALAVAAISSPALLQQSPVTEWNVIGRFPILTGSEVQAARAILALIGFSACIGAGAWIANPHAAWRIRVESDYAAFLAGSPRSPRPPARFFVLWLAITVLVLLSLIRSLQWSHTYHDKGVIWYDTLTRESGFFETLTAVTLLFAGVLFLFTAIRFGVRGGVAAARWAPMTLGILLILGAGEEVSWGQHWLHFDTPESFRALNDQGEFNLHNISTHLANHLMVLFFLCYVGLLPVVTYYLSEVRYVVERLNIPLCPLVFAPFAVVGVSMSEAIPGVWGNPLWSPNEARETLFGVIMLGVSISYYLTRNERLDGAPA